MPWTTMGSTTAWSASLSSCNRANTALIASFATFGVGFAARPLGGLFFGTIGDRLGRTWVLVVTILLMGGSSTLVGALPT